MPFASEKQKRYLWAKKPEVAREFAAKEKKMPSKAQLTTKAVSEAVKRAPMHMPNEISKMSPDPSEVHVPGALRTRRPKGRLKKVTTSGM